VEAMVQEPVLSMSPPLPLNNDDYDNSCVGLQWILALNQHDQFVFQVHCKQETKSSNTSVATNQSIANGLYWHQHPIPSCHLGYHTVTKIYVRQKEANAIQMSINSFIFHHVMDANKTNDSLLGRRYSCSWSRSSFSYSCNLLDI